MLTIRLTRKGKKNQPFFRVVVIDKRRSSKGGRAVEDLGYKNPLTKKVSINKERALYWISKGAQPSPTIHNLLIAEKIIKEDKIKIFNKSKRAAEAEKKAADDAAAAAAAPAPEVAPVAPEAQAEPAPEAPKEEPKAEEKPAEEAKPDEPKA